MLSKNPGPAEASPTRPWPADRVERWPIERLIPYVKNPRLHSEADVDKIAASIGSPRREESWGHGTQKPVEAMRRPIVNNSRPGELVYDPFLGSGTSLIAAEMTGRLCYGLELCPTYVDVIVRRWQAFTGRTAIHQASGQPFDERAASQDPDGGSGHG
jgi:DNA modification methylase